MKYDFRLDGNKKYDKIFLFGAGFSLEFFDWTQIDDNSIIIASNAVVSKLPFCDYFIVSNWFTLRKSVMDFVDINKTKILLWSKLSPDPCIISDDFFPDLKISRELLLKINEIVLNKKPVMVDYKMNSILLEKIKDINYYKDIIEHGIIPCGNGAMSGIFNIAFYLSEIYNIPKIYYIGFDGIIIQNFRYPYCLNKSLSYVNNQVIPRPDFDYSNINYKDINIYPNYGLQLALLLLLIGSIDKVFYDKLESQSILSINNIFNYQDIKDFRLYLMDKYINKHAKNETDDGYNLLVSMPNEIDDIEFNLFKDKKMEYIYYQRLKSLCINKKVIPAVEVKK